MSGYPGASRQGGMYAIQYLRWVMASGTATEIGPDALALLTAIVIKEDQLRYQRPPNFWQSQLLDECGMRSPHALASARGKLIKAGLLSYTAGNKGQPAVYYSIGFGGAGDTNQADSIGIRSGFDAQNASQTPDTNHIRSGFDAQNASQTGASVPSPIPKPKKNSAARFSPPTVEEVRQFATEARLAIDPGAFVDYYTSNGWKVGRAPMKDWHAALRSWARRDFGGRAAATPPERRKMDVRRELV